MISSMIFHYTNLLNQKSYLFADLQSSSWFFLFWRREILADALKYWCFFIVKGLNNSS